MGNAVAKQHRFNCVCCWRRLSNWTSAMSGVPLIVTPGNHDVSRLFYEPGIRDEVPFFLRYLPQQRNLSDIEPNDRPSYHAHIVGDRLLVLGLDSGLIEPVAGAQTEWLNTTLAKYNH